MLSPVREEENEDNKTKQIATDKNQTNPTLTNKIVSEELKDSGTEMQSIKALNSKIKDSIEQTNSIHNFGFKRAVTQPKITIDIIN
mmetsp:Transcript_37757/g.57814  ORF Transcript_37757/g.57814 Transcript_37757/m.57814 type:complete len:86 (-) Transcript_37757:2547-2804(-)